MIKKYLNQVLLLFIAIVLVSASSCQDKEKGQMYEIAEEYVKEFAQSEYNGYSLFDIHSRLTKDSTYRITPMGRLIIIKNEKGGDSIFYNKLQKEIEKHYKGDERVNEVYINTSGTVVIDCRR